ncbi:hypothetical protein [Halolamina salifodinae]|uniref:Uncharacterized protein n=1 Tax=Halolamina salifodinae TaxID=1202767 RepID=A0A8T4GWX9_9EURY|nr:hypothetical protein [Halolamina salifodinae]MBP1985798.1 hypothetical protein [Halolamina salifodinae]
MLPTPSPAQFAAGAAVLFSLFAALLLALWVGYDAATRSEHPLAWAGATFLAGLSPLAVGAVGVTLLYRRSRPELGSIPPPAVGNGAVPRGEVLGEAQAEGEGEIDDSGSDLGGFEMADPVDADA